MLNKKLTFFFWLLILANLIIGLVTVFGKYLIFHIDVARDFLLLNEVLTNNPIMLIGARTAISGLYHGPAWIYLNLAVFWLTGGNPVFVNLFWWLLYLLVLITIYYLVKKNYSALSALFTTAILSSQIIFFIRSITNPFGAFCLTVPFFFTLKSYLQKKQLKDLILTVFILGFTIQFEAAFGAPLTILTFIYLFQVLLKTKKLNHLAAFLFLLFPLSSYLVFDFRHSFLQTQAVIHYLLEKNTASFSIFIFLGNRLFKMIFLAPQFFFGFPFEKPLTFFDLRLLNFFIFLLGGWVIFHILTKAKKTAYEKDLLLLSYFYGGFFLITLLFKGDLPWYYYWPLSTFVALLISLSVKIIDKRIVTVVIGISCLINLLYGISTLKIMDQKHLITWQFYEQLGINLFTNAKEKEFGYFINTVDLLSNYQLMYTVIYNQKKFPQTKALALTKKKYTYLLLGGNPDGTVMNNSWWEKNRLKIDKKPKQTQLFKNGFIIKTYLLTKKEQQIAADQNIYQSVLFR